MRRFFLLIVCTFVGTLAQDVLLEPYGALVLGMSVADTTRLTAWWGLRVLAAMLLSGGWLLRVVNPLALLRTGLVATIAVFAGVIAAGAAGNPDAFRALVALMGLGTGLAGAGMLGGIAQFSTSVRAGLLMGVWGTASLAGKAAGSLLGGAVVDAVRIATGAAFPSDREGHEGPRGDRHEGLRGGPREAQNAPQPASRVFAMTMRWIWLVPS